MNEKDLLISPSLYTLFLYTLVNDEWFVGDFVLSERIPASIHKKLSEIGADVFTMPERRGICNFLSNIDYLRFLKFSASRSYRCVYGNDEFMPSCKYRSAGIALIEDGPFNKECKKFFIQRRRKISRFWLNYWLCPEVRSYIPYGYDAKVMQIYHTASVTLDDEIAGKGRLIDLNALWKDKGMKQKNRILDLFGVDGQFVENIDNYSTVLVTQILPIPDADKIEYYKQLLDGIDESRVLIKTHYAETTDYQSVFPESLVISQPVPFQLFKLLGYSPRKVLTICSSAITTFIGENTDITFLGSEVDPRVSKVYGIIKLGDFCAK